MRSSWFIAYDPVRKFDGDNPDAAIIAQMAADNFGLDQSITAAFPSARCECANIGHLSRIEQLR